MGIKLIKMSVIYFAIGVLLGYYMSISHSHDLAPVHAHINLLGWTALTLAGIIYHIFPDLSRNKLGIGHFWLHSFGLPIMMGSLFALITTKNDAWVLGTAIGATLTVLGVLFFCYNVFRNLK